MGYAMRMTAMGHRQLHTPSSTDGAILDIALHSNGLRQVLVQPAQRSPIETTFLFKVRVADTDGHRGAASMLIEQRYRWRGYAVDHKNTERPDSITLCASNATQVLGTVTVGLDGASGLLCEATYPHEVARLRVPGARLCELTRFAIDQTELNKQVMAALLHIAYLYAYVVSESTTLLIEVNPRHVGYYTKALGFAVVGSERNCERAAAPSVLLSLPLTKVRALIRKYGGQQGYGSAKNLYTYCFSEQEETGILGRILAINGASRKHSLG